MSKIVSRPTDKEEEKVSHELTKNKIWAHSFDNNFSAFYLLLFLPPFQVQKNLWQKQVKCEHYFAQIYISKPKTASLVVKRD